MYQCTLMCNPCSLDKPNVRPTVLFYMYTFLRVYNIYLPCGTSSGAQILLTPVFLQQAFISFMQLNGQHVTLTPWTLEHVGFAVVPHSGKYVLKWHIGCVSSFTVPINFVTNASHFGRHAFGHATKRKKLLYRICSKYIESTQSWNNVDPTLIRRQDVESTLFQCGVPAR